MAATEKTLRTCPEGHEYYKSSDCPVCPVCAEVSKPAEEFISLLSAPARRALQNNGITTPVALSAFSECEILKLHGIGPSAIPILRNALNDAGLSFKQEK